MVLSKPIYNFLGFYFEQLFRHPLRTKAISSCVISAAGNLASQYISGNKTIIQETLLAYALFGLCFGGTLPHFFFGWLERVVPDEAAFVGIQKLLLERLVYSPIFHAVALYSIARFEGKKHNVALKQLQAMYWPILLTSWKYLTVVQLLNLQFVPPMLQVLIVNLIGFFWTVYISNKRRQQQLKEK